MSGFILHTFSCLKKYKKVDESLMMYQYIHDDLYEKETYDINMQLSYLISTQSKIPVRNKIHLLTKEIRDKRDSITKLTKEKDKFISINKKMNSFIERVYFLSGKMSMILYSLFSINYWLIDNHTLTKSDIFTIFRHSNWVSLCINQITNQKEVFLNISKWDSFAHKRSDPPVNENFFLFLLDDMASYPIEEIENERRVDPDMVLQVILQYLDKESQYTKYTEYEVIRQSISGMLGKVDFNDIFNKYNIQSKRIESVKVSSSTKTLYYNNTINGFVFVYDLDVQIVYPRKYRVKGYIIPINNIILLTNKDELFSYSEIYVSENIPSQNIKYEYYKNITYHIPEIKVEGRGSAWRTILENHRHQLNNFISSKIKIKK